MTFLFYRRPPRVQHQQTDDEQKELAMPAVKMVKQVSPVVVDPPLPSDPTLRAVVDDVLAKLRYSFAAMAAAEQPVAPGRLDETFRGFLASRRESSRSRYQAKARALLEAPVPVRASQLGRYSALDPKEYRNLGSDAMASRFGKLPVDPGRLKDSLAKFRARFAVMPKLPKITLVDQDTTDTSQKQVQIQFDPDVMAGLMFKKMRLFIKKVRCIEETDEVGSDEISLGGTVTNPFGTTSLVNQFEVSDDFDEGEAVDFGLSKVFATWNLETKPVGFPYVYSAVIAMAEKDDGGFHSFLKALWEKIDEEVKAAIAGLVGAAVGAALGTIIPGLGTIIGALCGFLIGVFIDWVISWFDNPDDIVRVKTMLMTLASSRKSYYDWAQLTQPQGWTTTLNFKGDGGLYKVDVAYRVFTQ
jgi:hypothetical protein